MSFTRFDSGGQETFQPGRRDFGKVALGGVLGALLAPRKAEAAVHPNAPGIKLCAQSGANPTDDQLLFLKQIGAEYVSVGSTSGYANCRGFPGHQEDATPTPASRYGTSAIPACTTCRK